MSRRHAAGLALVALLHAAGGARAQGAEQPVPPAVAPAQTTPENPAAAASATTSASIAAAAAAAGPLSIGALSVPPNADTTLHVDTIAVRLRDVALVAQDATAVPRMTGGTLTLDDLAARVYGGALSGDAAIDTATGDQHWHLVFERIDLAAVTRALAGGGEGQAGTIDGWADLDLPHGDIPTMTGTGELLLHDADLIRFGALANLLIGDVTGRAHTDSAELRFDIADNRLRLRASRIVSASLLVEIRGTVGLDGSLDLIAIPYPGFKAVRSVPVIGNVAAWLFGAASSRVGRAVVRGELGNPVISLAPFAQ